MGKELAQGLVLGVAVGLAAGVFIGRMTVAPATGVTSAPTPAPPAAPAGPMGATPGQLQAHIFELEQATRRDPKDVQAWIALGNACFDAHQAQRSVDAYAKALELDPTNVSVLTDQGVMFRELKAFDKALANFEKAQKLQPDHLQSLFNLGVVYNTDLHQKEKARKALLRLIEKHPASPQAEEARAALEGLK